MVECEWLSQRCEGLSVWRPKFVDLGTDLGAKNMNPFKVQGLQ